jgi:hypothetical protein
MKPRSLASVCFLALLATVLACGEFPKRADAQFGDQNFKSAIALIELHKVRFGSYPDRLSDLRFTGQWDQIWISAVKYTKLPDGYELDLVRGWVGTPELSYPPEFWQGLGLRKSNMKRSGGA